MFLSIPGAFLLVLSQQTSTPPPATTTSNQAQPPSAEVPAVKFENVPDASVNWALEELRKGELVLDAVALESMIAASFTLIEGNSRVSGAFAFLEPIRRMRERGGVVRELRFEMVNVRVYGGSAVVTYRYRKSWKDQGSIHRQEGWASDVFERQDGGAWILVLRHRAQL